MLLDKILIQVLAVLIGMRCVSDTIGVFVCQFSAGFHSGTVIVEKTMNALIDG